MLNQFLEKIKFTERNLSLAIILAGILAPALARSLADVAAGDRVAGLATPANPLPRTDSHQRARGVFLPALSRLHTSTPSRRLHRTLDIVRPLFLFVVDDIARY